MTNILILGSGRSGTSLAASLFRNAGMFQGMDLLEPTISNQNGYFECRQINRLNNQLIQLLLEWPASTRRLQPYFRWPAHLDRRCYWAAAPKRLRPVSLSNASEEVLTDLIGRQPFCFKDPRFNLTLPIWQRYLPDNVRHIVIFREPEKTVDSMLRDAREVYKPPLPFSERWCYLSWYRTYRRLLYDFSSRGEWLFVHYDRLIDGQAIPALRAFSEAMLDTSLINPSLSRSRPEGTHTTGRLFRRCLWLYAQLDARANEGLSNWLSSPGGGAARRWLQDA